MLTKYFFNERINKVMSASATGYLICASPCLHAKIHL